MMVMAIIFCYLVITLILIVTINCLGIWLRKYIEKRIDEGLSLLNELENINNKLDTKIDSVKIKLYDVYLDRRKESLKKKREIGFEFEDLAKKYLIEKGMRYIESNFYTRYGEIDLIFTDEDEKILVFVEVRYRKNAEFGEPIETIDRRKLEKIIISSQIYIKEKRWKQDVRYDFIGIKKDESGNNKINWIKNAF